jgi:hypothetical protein
VPRASAAVRSGRDWESSVPMIGGVLHTVNVRFSAEQILYTINHAEDNVILINSDFLPLLQQIWDRVEAGKKLILLNNDEKPTQTSLIFDAEYEALLAGAGGSDGGADVFIEAADSGFTGLVVKRCPIKRVC